MPNTIFCIMGPTASGKTALACELVKQFPFEIISVDSAMIYREMDIGTAKPSHEELKIAPHHLIDIINPDETYSAAQFCSDATKLSQDIFARNKIPLLVGGTMMYFNALQQGLSVLPEANEQIRDDLDKKIKQGELHALYQELLRVDPLSAARIHANDAQRIQRALEVYYISGTPLSTFLAEQHTPHEFQFINFGLMPEHRAWLHERIAQRFDQMLAEGFIDEVKHLQSKWQLNLSLPSMRCVGYRQALEYLQGDYELATLREKGVAATRQLAKRQLTWLRHWNNVTYLDPENQSFVQDIMAKIKEIIDNN